jgi:hypothetical protein
VWVCVCVICVCMCVCVHVRVCLCVCVMMLCYVMWLVVFMCNCVTVISLYCRWTGVPAAGVRACQDDTALNEVLLRGGRKRQLAPGSGSSLDGGVRTMDGEDDELNEVLRRSIQDLTLREILQDDDLVSGTA